MPHSSECHFRNWGMRARVPHLLPLCSSLTRRVLEKKKRYVGASLISSASHTHYTVLWLQLETRKPSSQLYISCLPLFFFFFISIVFAAPEERDVVLRPAWFLLMRRLMEAIFHRSVDVMRKSSIRLHFATFPNLVQTELHHCFRVITCSCKPGFCWERVTPWD